MTQGQTSYRCLASESSEPAVTTEDGAQAKVELVTSRYKAASAVSQTLDAP